MAYNKSPIWEFSDVNQTGIDKVPLNRLVFIQSTGHIFQKTSHTGLTSTSTISDILKDASLFKSMAGSVGGSNSAFNLSNFTIGSDYIIPVGMSATTVGDSNGIATIKGGITVTVSAGSKWEIR
jgi:hypothetical protein